MTDQHNTTCDSSRRLAILRRNDQVTVAAGLLIALAGMLIYWWSHGGHRGRLVELDDDTPQTALFQIDLNSADWPEITQLPRIGETLARRIVDNRQEYGPFRSVDELNRVPGIGPKTIARTRPYLLPIEPPDLVVGPYTP